MSDPNADAQFTVLLPMTVTDTILTSTTVPDVARADEYAGGTTYALGRIVGTTSGNFQSVYESLQAGNVGHTQASSPTYWRLIGVAAAEYNAGTSYALNAIIGTTSGKFQYVYKSLQAANIGHTQASSPTYWELIGAVNVCYDKTVTYALDDIVAYISTNVHLLYKSTTASNTGNALSDTTKWTLLGSTNARAMFDDTYGSQTTNENSIVVVLAPGVLVNSLWFGNMDAASVRVQQSVSGFDETTMLNEHGVTNWYDWFYLPIVRKSDLASIANIPPYPSSTLTVTISNVGSTAKCGIMVMGVGRVLGLTNWEILAGIVSYSGTTTDGFGNTKFLSRAKVKKLKMDVNITKGYHDEAFRIMTECTDKPLVVIGTTRWQMAQAYCSLGTWELCLSNKGKPMSVEVKGLT